MLPTCDAAVACCITPLGKQRHKDKEHRCCSACSHIKVKMLTVVDVAWCAGSFCQASSSSSRWQQPSKEVWRRR